MTIEIKVSVETWPLKTPFVISRGSKDSAEVLLVQIFEHQRLIAQGEGVPYKRYQETPKKCIDILNRIIPALKDSGLNRTGLQKLLTPGAARNAMDCAIWDYESKKHQQSPWKLANLRFSGPVETVQTISIDTPENMAAAARSHSKQKTLKIKSDGQNDLEKISCIHQAAPDCQLILDANESWTFSQLQELAPKLKDLNVCLIEQPLPEGQDECLTGYRGGIPLCADESFKTRTDLNFVRGKYQFVNIKLDKTGGLTEALLTQKAVLDSGLSYMTGCMVCTSLSVAPLLLLTRSARWNDLDGPLWLRSDRSNALNFQNHMIHSFEPSPWGFQQEDD